MTKQQPDSFRTRVSVGKHAFSAVIPAQVYESELKLAWGVFVHSGSLAGFDFLVGKFVCRTEHLWECMALPH